MFLNKGCLDDTNPSWKIFGLVLQKEKIKENIKLCPKTMKIINKCQGVINVGFSYLEPGVKTALHHDFNHDILRCHIPILIPVFPSGININGETKTWNINEFFIFDDTFEHQAWNYTKEKRVVLIIDILKNKGTSYR